MVEHSNGSDGSDGSAEQQEQQLDDQQQLEENVISIIGKINKARNRACIQNIHNFINRRGRNIGVEKVKKLIEILISRNIIMDKGKSGKESFYVVEIPSESPVVIDMEESDLEGMIPILTPFMIP